MLNAEYWRDMNKIFLIGFMGAGKTHWGKRLASGKGCAFADTDTETERTADAPVSAIFEASGEAGFRLLERESLRRLCADPRPMIVATGGGLPCFFDNMDQMRRHGCTIYLKMPVTVLAERIGQAAKFGVDRVGVPQTRRRQQRSDQAGRDLGHARHSAEPAPGQEGGRIGVGPQPRQTI